ncbi:hypothetical protein HHL19_16035 [Streptomyces sp. R302]|uniref:hypothetical protein n=1 Tax=unclassified Streptomyces TaxID=2593676 RepID=UPI00145CCD4C|nr:MULTISPECIES: hypothetical protein [unclassified Streptomyces]NML51576.1 hypothetical protein [Streptomyces sp. R301]NML80154.1 hypothetical protein [Streptomyces sp. R302]
MSNLQSWGFLAGGAVVILVPSVAVLTGRRPGFLRGSRGPTPLLGITGLCVYAAVLVDEIPRVTGASSGVRATCAYIGLGLMGTAVGLFILYDVLGGADRRARK